jgi:hypothetical protein
MESCKAFISISCPSWLLLMLWSEGFCDGYYCTDYTRRTIYMYKHNKPYSIVQNNCLAIWLASWRGAGGWQLQEDAGSNQRRGVGQRGGRGVRCLFCSERREEDVAARALATGGAGAFRWRCLRAARVALATHGVYGDLIEMKGMRDIDRDMYKRWHML